MDNIELYAANDKPDLPLWGGIYFHGTELEGWVQEHMQDKHAPLDLVCSKHEVPEKGGIYAVVVYGKACVLYLWDRADRPDWKAGLIVIAGTPLQADAEEKYARKAISI
jgi:hypothetical protein